MGSGGNSVSWMAMSSVGMMGLLEAEVAARMIPPLGKGVVPERKSKNHFRG